MRVVERAHLSQSCRKQLHLVVSAALIIPHEFLLVENIISAFSLALKSQFPSRRLGLHLRVSEMDVGSESLHKPRPTPVTYTMEMVSRSSTSSSRGTTPHRSTCSIRPDRSIVRSAEAEVAAAAVASPSLRFRPWLPAAYHTNMQGGYHSNAGTPMYQQQHGINVKIEPGHPMPPQHTSTNAEFKYQNLPHQGCPARTSSLDHLAIPSLNASASP